MRVSRTFGEFSLCAFCFADEQVIRQRVGCRSDGFPLWHLLYSCVVACNKICFVYPNSLRALDRVNLNLPSFSEYSSTGVDSQNINLVGSSELEKSL